MNYQEIINKLYSIAKEEELLQNLNKNSHYKAHIELPGTFQDLLINLKRENELIDEKLNRYLKELTIKQDEQLNKQILKLIEKKDANEYLYNYINQLVKEKELLIKQKKEYETKKRTIKPNH